MNEWIELDCEMLRMHQREALRMHRVTVMLLLALGCVITDSASACSGPGTMARIRGVEEFSFWSGVALCAWLIPLTWIHLVAGGSLLQVSKYWLLGLLHPGWTISAQRGDCGEFKLLMTWVFFALLLVAFRLGMNQYKKLKHQAIGERTRTIR